MYIVLDAVKFCHPNLIFVWSLGGVPWVQNIGSNLTRGRPKISDALLVQSMEQHTLKNVCSC